jgi:hypothetical protein
MDPTVIEALIRLGTYGPLGLMAGLGFYLFITERKKTSELTTKLVEFARVSIDADHEHSQAMEALGGLYDLGVKSAETNTEMTGALGSLKDAVERVEAKVEKIYEPKRR